MPKLAARRPDSLLQRLLTAIVGPLMVLAIALGVGGGVLIHSLTQRTSDRVLLGSLTAIAETVAIEDNDITLDLPPAAFGMLEDAERDNVYYSVRQGGTLITGYRDLPSVEPRNLQLGEPALRTVAFRGSAVRIAAVAKRLPHLDEPVVVQVAETMKARNKLQLRMAAILAVLEVALVAGAAFLVPNAVTRALEPLEQLRRDMESRSSSPRLDLSPLTIEEAPRELKPFVGAFNELLRQLENSTASMRRFVGDASHQMRTPLAALRTHLAIARRDATHAAAGDPLAEVDAAALRLERLLTQLLSLARAEEQGDNPGLSSIDIVRIARGVTAEWAPKAVAGGVQISFEACAGEAVEARANPLLLNELLANVVDNAIRYTGAGGHVVVRVRADPAPQIEVEDDGPGLTPAEQQKVMRRFARLPRDMHLAGTGLGLAIVETLANRMAGKLEMAQPSSGRGLIVRLILTR